MNSKTSCESCKERFKVDECPLIYFPKIVNKKVGLDHGEGVAVPKAMIKPH